MGERKGMDSGRGAKIENIRNELYAAGGRNSRDILRYQVSLISDDALGMTPYPAENFGLILEFMSKNELFSKRGAHEFFFSLMTDFYKFSEDQKRELFNVLFEEFLGYNDLKLYWAVCDIIARNYEKAEALRFFRENYRVASAAGREGIKLGLDIIAHRSQGEPSVAAEIAAILGP